jgi:HSP20 family protein
MSILAALRRSPAYGVGSFSPLYRLQQDFDRIFNATQSSQVDENPVAFVPPVDVREDENSLTVVVELPGVSKEDVHVSLHDGVLAITGERKPEQEPKNGGYHLRERSFGRFQRTLRVNLPVNEDSVKAAYKEGVLTVTLPKTPEAKPRQIDISGN